MHLQRRLLLPSTRTWLALGAVGLVVALGCERQPRTRETAQAPPSVGTTELTRGELEGSEPSEGELPRGVSALPVEGEPTSFVVGAARAVTPRILYFHGMCSDARRTAASSSSSCRT